MAAAGAALLLGPLIQGLMGDQGAVPLTGTLPAGGTQTPQVTANQSQNPQNPSGAVQRIMQNTQQATPVAASSTAPASAPTSAPAGGPNATLANIQAGAEIGALAGDMLRGSQISPTLPQGQPISVAPTATQFMGRPGNEVGLDELLALLQRR